MFEASDCGLPLTWCIYSDADHGRRVEKNLSSTRDGADFDKRFMLVREVNVGGRNKEVYLGLSRDFSFSISFSR